MTKRLRRRIYPMPSLVREGGPLCGGRSPRLTFAGRGCGAFVNVMLATQANALGKAEGIAHLRLVVAPPQPFCHPEERNKARREDLSKRKQRFEEGLFVAPPFMDRRRLRRHLITRRCRELPLRGSHRSRRLWVGDTGRS